MIFLPFAAIICGMTALIFFLYARDNQGSVPAVLLKALTSFLFILTASLSFLANQNSVSSVFYVFTIMGLTCGLIGDIILDLKILYPVSSSLYQHGGMISFLAGHLFYLIALIFYSAFSYAALIYGLVIALVINIVSTFFLQI